MPIDPSIAMSFRDPQWPNPLDSAMKGMSLQNAGMQNQIDQQNLQQGQMSLQQAGLAQQTNAALNTSIGKNMVTNPDGTMSLNGAGVQRDMATAGYGRAGLEFGAQQAQIQMANATAKATFQKTKLDNAKATADLIGAHAGGVTDQNSYDASKADLQSMGIDTSQMPAVYDPAYVQQQAANAVTAADKITQAQKAADLAQRTSNDAQTLAQKTANDAQVRQDTEGRNAQQVNYQNQEIEVRRQELGIQGAHLALDRQNVQNMGGGTAGPVLVDAIGSGQMAPERMSFLLAKNPGLLNDVMQKYPDFDSSKVAAYPGVYKDFTSSKPNTAGGSLLAGGVALKHLQELKNMNTVQSHIPGTPDYTAYQNKADTLSGELGRFYGTDTIPAIAAIKSTLASTLPGNRQAAISTQAQSMGDRLNSYQQTWDNAAPSSRYQAPMPGLDAEAMHARAALDPRYKAPQARSTTAAGGSQYKLTATGSDGHKIGSNDGGNTWVDVQSGKPLR